MPLDARAKFAPQPTLPQHDGKNLNSRIDDAPEGWIQDYFLVDNIPVYYYVARAEKERGVMVGCAGLKSKNPLSIAAVNTLNESGISVMMMALPNPERELGFMPHFRKVFERFALDKNSPVHSLFPKELPKFLYGHSTGGLLALRTLTKTVLFKKFEEMGYKAASIEAPFSDTAGASLHHSAWAGRTAFNAYACWHKNKLPKETFGGLWYLHHSENKTALNAALSQTSPIKRIHLRLSHIFNTSVETMRDLSNFKISQRNDKFYNSSLPLKFVLAVPFAASYILHSNVRNMANAYMLHSHIKPTAWFLEESDFRTPTYGQILEDQNVGRKFTARLSKSVNPQTALPTSIVASENDPFSCTKTTHNDIAKPLQANFYKAEGLHNPNTEDPLCLQHSINQMLPYLLDKPLAIPTEKTTPKTKPSRWSLITSGDRFTSALQASTSLLNPLTRGLKGFFGGRVGDSEMGAEAERRTVNGGNTLAL